MRIIRLGLGVLGAVGILTVGTDAHAVIPYADGITPGQLRGIAWTPGDPWPIGYWEYLPSHYDDVPEGTLFPVLLSLGGIPSSNTSSHCPNGTPTCTVQNCGGDLVSNNGLCRALRRGATVPIFAGTWDDLTRPFLVFTPQNPVAPNSPEDYNAAQLDDLVIGVN